MDLLDITVLAKKDREILTFTNFNKKFSIEIKRYIISHNY